MDKPVKAAKLQHCSYKNPVVFLICPCFSEDAYFLAHPWLLKNGITSISEPYNKYPGIKGRKEVRCGPMGRVLVGMSYLNFLTC